MVITGVAKNDGVTRADGTKRAAVHGAFTVDESNVVFVEEFQTGDGTVLSPLVNWESGE